MNDRRSSDAKPRRTGFMTRPRGGESLPTAGGHLLAGAAATRGRVSIIESEVPPGDETPLHVHHAMDEAFYVVEGEYMVTCGDETFTATAGCLVYLPHGLPHSYRAGPQGGRKLIFGLPAGIEDLFRDMAALDDVDELGKRHGITFLTDQSDDR